jgi:drug/metabolite transporter (DMT)-like permease
MAQDVGVLLVLIAALALAGQAVFIRLGTERGRSSDALVVVLLVNVALIVPYAVLTGPPGFGLTTRSVLAFVAAGLVGTMLGRAFYYAGIQRVGASRAEPIKASMPLYSTVFAVVVLEEVLTTANLLGILLIVAGVAAISREASTSAVVAADGVPWRGLAFPLVGALMYGVEPVFAKIGLAEGTPVAVGLGIKSLAATLGFLAYLRWRGELPTLRGLGTGDTRWYLAAGLANTVFLVSYYLALEVSPVVLVVPVMQTSPLFVIVISVLFFQRIERVTWRLASGAVVVVAGAVVVSVYA